MPTGGELAITAANVSVDEEAALRIHSSMGSYVLLTVRDTGRGMPRGALPKMSEAFSDSDPADNVTGLGLTTVVAIVKHHGGGLEVVSEPKKGTEFRIYFPAIPTAIAWEETPTSFELPFGHGELVLLIEDEDTVRDLTKTTLEDYGYHVLTASNGLQSNT